MFGSIEEGLEVFKQVLREQKERRDKIVGVALLGGDIAWTSELRGMKNVLGITSKEAEATKREIGWYST